MADLLRRSLAPVSDEAWKQIDETAVRVVKSQLSARTVATLLGPSGWELAAVNLGRLEVAAEPGPGGCPWGLRKVLPLVEVRVPFFLPQAEIDNIARGAKDVDLDPIEKAARQVAMFEETVIYRGSAPAQVRGILESSAHQPVPLPQSPEEYPRAVADAVKRLSLAGIGGPYVLVLGPDPFFALMQSHESGYPPHRVVREILGGPIHFSPALTGGVVLSTEDDYFELTVGQDLSVGYAVHDRQKIEFFLTESFTFRVLEDQAAVALG